MGELPRYSRRVAEAFRTKTRKQTSVPYLTHLMQVAVWVWENGGDEDQFIAGLLHDYLEDIPGASEEGLAARFGERVARLVRALSDTTVRPKPPWEERKRKYVEAIHREAGVEAPEDWSA